MRVRNGAYDLSAVSCAYGINVYECMDVEDRGVVPRSAQPHFSTTGFLE